MRTTVPGIYTNEQAWGIRLMTTVTVIIVNYNGASYISRCLTSLVQQTYSAFKAIIVDNASTDESKNVLQDLDSRFEVIFLDRNVGFAAANNLALKLAQTQWVATLNPDAFPRPDWLEKLMRGTEMYPQVTFFGSVQIQDRVPDRLDGIGDVYSGMGLFWRGAFDYPLGAVTSDGEIFSPCAAAALYRSDTVKQAGGFDESFFCYCEDVDLGFRLRLMGHKCVLVKDAVVGHLGSESVGRYGEFAIYHGFRNRIWTFVKNYPGPLFFVMAPLTLITFLALAFDKIRIGRSAPALAGLKDALVDLRRVWEQRRKIQASRTQKSHQIYRSMCWSPLKLLRRGADVRKAPQ